MMKTGRILLIIAAFLETMGIIVNITAIMTVGAQIEGILVFILALSIIIGLVIIILIVNAVDAGDKVGEGIIIALLIVGSLATMAGLYQGSIPIGGILLIIGSALMLSELKKE